MVAADAVHHAPMAICASEKSESSRLCFCGSRKAPAYLIQRQALVSHLASVSFGIFVDLRQGQVGVEFVSILLRNEKQLLLDPPPATGSIFTHVLHTTHTKSCIPRGAVAVKTLESLTHPRLLGQVSVHLLLAEWSHFLYLLVVQLHSLLILGDLLSIKQLVCRGVLEHTKKKTALKNLDDEAPHVAQTERVNIKWKPAF